MLHGARTSLAALILALGLGGASAESVATTWTDPPAHKPATEKAPAADQKAAAPATAASTPAAATKARPTPAKRTAVAARREPERKAARGPSSTAKRFAAAPRRARITAAPARMIRSGPQIAAAPPPPPEGYARYRAYNYGPGYGYGYAPDDTDDRLDRLSSAQAAGYVVVRRRTVQFPDGRTLRVYRPDPEGEPF